MPITIAWKDPAGPVSVEYSPEAVEKIRRLAFDGLMSLPRVGLGVGGFLLGRRGARKIEILDFHPIGCLHAKGPSFSPTADEIAEAQSALNGRAGAILGCYCSRPRRDLTLSDSDRALLEGGAGGTDDSSQRDRAVARGAVLPEAGWLGERGRRGRAGAAGPGG
jgi:hypothetical protein